MAVGGAVVGYAIYLRSDAYRRGNRLFYREGRPNALGRVLGEVYSWAGVHGIGPSWFASLETVGHRTGRRHAVPVVVADHGGERYIVSMLGEQAGWVHNVRAADGRPVLAHGRRDEVLLVEVPPDERAPVLKTYVARAPGGRPHFPVDPAAPLEEFKRIASGYPVFRVESPAPTVGRRPTPTVTAHGEPIGKWLGPTAGNADGLGLG